MSDVDTSPTQVWRKIYWRLIPILSIALSTGYQSINTFNRGFRDVMGMTPSAYRAMPPIMPPACP